MHRGVLVRFQREEQYFCFEGSGIRYELSKDKITDIAVKTDVEIQKQYVSSAGGALARRNVVWTTWSDRSRTYQK